MPVSENNVSPFRSGINPNPQCRKSFEQRFWEKVNKDGPVPGHAPHLGNCWVWTGGICTNGYGQIRHGGRSKMSHRIAWEMKNGTIPDGLIACHKCDNRQCVRSEHLFLGTDSDNMRDMVSKNRASQKPLETLLKWKKQHPEQHRGDSCHLAKITEIEARAIKAAKDSGKTRKEIASLFGVSKDTVHHIWNGTSWKWL